MKLNTMTTTPRLILALALVLAVQQLPAADALVYEAQPAGSEMRIDGTATGKTWHCIGKLIAGSFEVEPAWQKDLSLKSVTCLGTGKAPKAEVSIPIRSLKSQAAAGASIMDRRMQKEMKAEQFPKIEYKLTEMVIKGEVPASGSPVTFDAKGKLAISGVTNEVSFPITMERDANDMLKFKGTHKTKMTAFGITPPEFALLGIGLKTGDDVTLTWTWVTALKK
jgi:polyisoprenoid-binding protein YceI